MDDPLSSRALFDTAGPECDEFPLKVVPDWDEQLIRAQAACDLIDRHLNYEARGRILRDPADFRPVYLCPEQRVQLVTDLHGYAR